MRGDDASDDRPEVPTAAVAGAGIPNAAQMAYLRRGLDQPGAKLPLFDEDGQRVGEDLVQGCIDRGWAEPWYVNALKPDWQVCKLTAAGDAAARAALRESAAA